MISLDEDSLIEIICSCPKLKYQKSKYKHYFKYIPLYWQNEIKINKTWGIKMNLLKRSWIMINQFIIISN